MWKDLGKKFSDIIFIIFLKDNFTNILKNESLSDAKE